MSKGFLRKSVSKCFLRKSVSNEIGSTKTVKKFRTREKQDVIFKNSSLKRLFSPRDAGRRGAGAARGRVGPAALGALLPDRRREAHVRHGADARAARARQPHPRQVHGAHELDARH